MPTLTQITAHFIVIIAGIIFWKFFSPSAYKKRNKLKNDFHKDYALVSDSIKFSFRKNALAEAEEGIVTLFAKYNGKIKGIQKECEGLNNNLNIKRNKLELSRKEKGFKY